MDIVFVVLLILLGAINIASFFIMMLDKMQSRKNNSERISEGALFFMAAALGGIGVYLGMLVFHHKTRKWPFILGIPLLIIQNIVFVGVLYNVFISLR